jgi:hypothetical protein
MMADQGDVRERPGSEAAVFVTAEGDPLPVTAPDGDVTAGLQKPT